MSARSEKAVARLLSDYNCAQAVLWSFSEDLGFDPDTALRIATGFGAGMGRRQEVCGAVTGGIMVLGLEYGRGEGQDKEPSEITYARTRELMGRFEAEHGTTICRELLDGCDLMTEEGQKAVEDRDLVNRTCAKCVKTVVAILEDVLSRGDHSTD